MESIIDLSQARVLFSPDRPWLALTGAGMSVDSGIPPFRGPGGLWEAIDPEEFAHVRTLERRPERAWELFRLLGRAIASALPHAGHTALARAEASGLVAGVATQNIDGLHQAAGSREVIELHGNISHFYCHHCGAPAPPEVIDPGTAVPRCPCGGVLRPTITLFGEPPPEGAFERALSLLAATQRLLVIGTSAEVYPAALLPDIARQRRMPVVVLGPDPNRLTGLQGVQWIPGRAAEWLPALFPAENAR